MFCRRGKPSAPRRFSAGRLSFFVVQGRREAKSPKDLREWRACATAAVSAENIFQENSLMWYGKGRSAGILPLPLVFPFPFASSGSGSFAVGQDDRGRGHSAARLKPGP